MNAGTGRAAPPVQHPWRAMAWMGLALSSFALLAVAARESLATLTPPQFLFLRTLLGLPLVLGLAWALRASLRRQAPLGLHLLRNVAHYGGQVAWVTAIGWLPLALVFALEFTAPLWAALLAVLFLGERLDRGRALALGLGLLGALLITRPGVQTLDWGMIVGLLAALGFGISLAATKGLTRYDSALTILWWMLLLQAVLGLVPALLTWQPLQWSVLPWLLVAALTGVSAHFALAKAFQQADATLVLPLDYLRLPLIMAVGALWYGEGLDWWLLAGAAVMLLGQEMNLRGLHARRRARRSTPST